MKVSVSLSEADLALLDEYVSQEGLPSRSAGVQTAIRRLHRENLRDAYMEAWRDWADSPDSSEWDMTVADGDDDAAR
ncbi:antitoxin [Actinomyces sp. 432]|nr:antitoxin [Actinomyces sp. 432]